jgi:hypothetical protein
MGDTYKPSDFCGECGRLKKNCGGPMLVDVSIVPWLAMFIVIHVDK